VHIPNHRAIAGSLIWINFDRHSLLNLVQQRVFLADIDEITPQYTGTADCGAVFQSSIARSSGIPAGATINALDTTLTSAGQNAELATPWYSDQILPFDVTLSGANEYGAMCAAKIFGLEILNEGLQTRCHRPALHKNSRARAPGRSSAHDQAQHRHSCDSRSKERGQAQVAIIIVIRAPACAGGMPDGMAWLLMMVSWTGSLRVELLLAGPGESVFWPYLYR